MIRLPAALVTVHYFRNGASCTGVRLPRNLRIGIHRRLLPSLLWYNRIFTLSIGDIGTGDVAERNRRRLLSSREITWFLHARSHSHLHHHHHDHMTNPCCCGASLQEIFIRGVSGPLHRYSSLGRSSCTCGMW